ncbi:MAG: hypothetical protein ACSLEZ_07500 [Thiobacillus sp.]
MCVFRKTRGLVGLMLLGPGMVVANGALPVASDTLPPVQTMPAMVASAPMWQQMMSVLGVPPFYSMPQSGMALPMLPQSPAPMIMSPAMPATWMPFAWVWVPVGAVTPAPAAVDYGPVADTPVIELPLADTAANIMMAPDGMAHASATVDADKRVTAGEATAEAPLVDVHSITDSSSSLPAAVMPAPVADPLAVAVSAVVVDYGPVTPTPVVDMLALEKQLARASLRKSSQPASKSAVTKSNKPVSTTPSKPVKKRMCWNNGVVAPCR